MQVYILCLRSTVHSSAPLPDVYSMAEVVDMSDVLGFYRIATPPLQKSIKRHTNKHPSSPAFMYVFTYTGQKRRTEHLLYYPGKLFTLCCTINTNQTLTVKSAQTNDFVTTTTWTFSPSGMFYSFDERLLQVHTNATSPVHHTMQANTTIAHHNSSPSAAMPNIIKAL